MNSVFDKVVFSKPDLLNLKRKGLTLADMHVHTKFSHDSQNSLFNIRDSVRKQGIGLAVTDHNDYRGPLALRRFDDLLVIPGIEVTASNNKDILMYFRSFDDLESFGNKHIDGKKKKERGLLSHRLKTSFIDLVDAANDYNALVSLPHPLARIKGSYYWLQKRLHSLAMKNIDAIEVINGSQRMNRNLKSVEWGALTKKSWVGGSDSHIIRTIGNVLTASYAEKPESFLEEINKKTNHVIGHKTKYSQEVLTAMIMIKNNLSKEL